MNYDEIFKIIEQLKEISPLKARKLSKLVEKHINEEHLDKLKSLERKINGYIYLVFVDLIDDNSRYEIHDLGLDILEECNSIEKDAGPGWIINYKGAHRCVIDNDDYVVVDQIPRSYKKGFYLTKESKESAILFYNNYNSILSMLSKRMDRRQEAITYTKKPKNAKISNEFLDELVDYLHLPKITEEKEIGKTYKKEI